MLSEIRFAARRLLHDRWSTAVAILVTGLGTGLNTAVFVVAYGVLERPLPYREAARLVLVDVPAPFTQLEDWRGRLASFEEIAGYAAEGFTVRGLAEPRFLMVAVVDDRFFETLGSTALTGRTFARHDSGAVAVLSERVARQSGAPIENLPGRTIAIGEMTATIVGVMPAAFEFPSQGTGVWIRGQAVPAIAFDRSPDARRFRLLGRLKPGVTLQQAGEDVRRNGSALDPEFSTTTVGQTLVRSLHEALVGGVRPALLALTAAAGIVLLGACANVATILIGRTIARRRELAVRTALGASRSRLFATIFSESILTAAAGAGLGAILAIGGVRAFASRAAGIVPRLGDVPIDWSMLAIALAVAAVSSILAAAPALRSIEPAGTRLRQDLSQSSSAVRIRAVLGASQIALAVLLLSAAGLLARTIVGLLGEDAGVETRGAVVSQLMLTDAMAFTAAERQRQMQHVLDRVRAMPGAVAAGAGSSLPPENAPIAITARFVSGSEITRTPELSLASVTPGYLEALGVRLLGGRYFEEPDERRGNLVAVLSESAARVLLPGINAVGGQLPIALPGMRDRGRATVLGVVADVKFTGLEAAAGPAVYVLWKELPAGQVYLALRTRADARSAAETLRATLRSAAPDMPVMPIRPLDEVMQRSVAGRSFRAQLAASLGLLAVGIAVLGVGAGLGRVVSERRRELAIRSALGATPGRAVRMILRHGAIITAAGIVVGLLATLAAGNLLRAFLFGISPHDPATLSVVVLIVATGSLSACYVPARSAAATNPLDMLREE